MAEARVVLITGASRGIGRQLAVDCGRAGLSVALNYRSNEERAREAVSELVASGAPAIAVRADVSLREEVAFMVREVLGRFGRIDCLINNAGIGPIFDFRSADEALFDETIRMNLRSAFLVTQEVVPHMIAGGSGRLIFMSSLAARTGGLVSPAYAASKAGLEGLMHYYATYLLPHRITANAIAPALVASDMVGAMDLPPLDTLPLCRLGRPDEIWPAVRMMLDTEYMTGQTIHINAGRLMT